MQLRLTARRKTLSTIFAQSISLKGWREWRAVGISHCWMIASCTWSMKIYKKVCVCVGGGVQYMYVITQWYLPPLGWMTNFETWSGVSVYYPAGVNHSMNEWRTYCFKDSTNEKDFVNSVSSWKVELIAKSGSNTKVYNIWEGRRRRENSSFVQNSAKPWTHPLRWDYQDIQPTSFVSDHHLNMQ